MRKLIAAMRHPLDVHVDAPPGNANWVTSWSRSYGLTPQFDACLISGALYPRYEEYWTALQIAPNRPLPMTGKLPTPDEIKWAHFIAQIPHYVLSSTLNSALWPSTHFLQRLDQVSFLKQEPGKDIYLVGDGEIVTTLIDAGLVDELRMILDPLNVGSRQVSGCSDGRTGPRKWDPTRICQVA